MTEFETETPHENNPDNWIEDEFKNIFAMYDEFISSATTEKAKLAAIERKGELLAKYVNICYAYAEESDAEAALAASGISHENSA